MTGRRWITLTFATILAVITSEVVIACAVDPYGVWRNPTGRKLAVYFAERRAKFLMSKRYVPANFDGLFIGPSSSANWDLSKITTATMFNESVSGGNAAEEHILVNQALPKGHYKLAIFILSQAMTVRHDIKEGLDKASTREALGSIHLFVHEAARALLAAHIKFDRSGTAPDGQFTLSAQKKLQAEALTPSFFAIDPVALEEYRDLVQTMRNRGAMIVYVVPPVYEPCYRSNKLAFQAYLNTIRTLLPAAPIIDLNGTEYIALRSDPDNFIDCFHVEPRGAERVSTILGDLVPRAIAAHNLASLESGGTLIKGGIGGQVASDADAINGVAAAVR